MAEKKAAAEPGATDTPVKDETQYGDQIKALTERLDAVEAKGGGADTGQRLDALEEGMRQTGERVAELTAAAGGEVVSPATVDELSSRVQSVEDSLVDLKAATAKATHDGPHRDISTLPRTEDL